MPLPDALLSLGLVIALVTWLLVLHYRDHPIPWPRREDEQVLILVQAAPRYCDECGSPLENNACPMCKGGY
jgi:hypothetical protein